MNARRPAASCWLDGAGRAVLEDGSFEELLTRRRITGAVSRFTGLERDLAHRAPAYDAHLNVLALRRVPPAGAVRELTVYDIRRTADLLAPLHRSSHRRHGFVSAELDPHLARDTSAALTGARALWADIARPNAVIAIPATPEGLSALTACLAEGINAAATLVFSLPRYAGTLDAFLTGLERARAAGRDLASLASAASFPLGPLDLAADRLLDRCGSREALVLRGRVAAANARVAYGIWQEVRSGPRWRALAAAGARPQRLLWSDPGPGPDGLRRVSRLAAPDTATAVSADLLRAAGGAPGAGGSLLPCSERDGWRTVNALAFFGTPYRELAGRLEADGLARSETAWRRLHSRTAAVLAARRAARGIRQAA